MTANPFAPDVVAAVLAHMNTDHAADSVLICRVFGGMPDAIAPVMIGLDGTGGDFEVDPGDGTAARVRVAWTESIDSRGAIRAQLAGLCSRASDLLAAEAQTSNRAARPSR